MVWNAVIVLQQNCTLLEEYEQNALLSSCVKDKFIEAGLDYYDYEGTCEQFQPQIDFKVECFLEECALDCDDIEGEIWKEIADFELFSGCRVDNPCVSDNGFAPTIGEELNLGLIIGAAVGGLVLAVLLVTLIVVLMLRGSSKRQVIHMKQATNPPAPATTTPTEVSGPTRLISPVQERNPRVSF